MASRQDGVTQLYDLPQGGGPERLPQPEKTKDKVLLDERGLLDLPFLALTVLLVLIGVIMVFSASYARAYYLTGNSTYYFARQAIFAVAGIAGMLFVSRLNYQLWRSASFIILLVSVFFLMLVPIIGSTANGAKRWIPLGPVNLQPMEFVKISLALYLAYFMSSKQALVKTFSRGVIPPFAVTGLFCGLLLLQPDFGSAVVVASILFFMCLAGGTRFIYLFFAMILACAGAMALAILEPYRLRRLLAFLDPFADPTDTGYHLVQSLLAIGSGGFFGVGVGASRQKMFYLPEAHNDFIMAVLAEELGFVGITVVMLLFGLLFWRCYRIIMRQTELRDRLTAFGLTVILAMGAVMNLAVVMGVAPPKGVPMPLMSYGGSNLMATMLCVGLLMNFSRTATGKEGSIWKESS